MGGALGCGGRSFKFYTDTLLDCKVCGNIFSPDVAEKGVRIFRGDAAHLSSLSVSPGSSSSHIQ